MGRPSEKGPNRGALKSGITHRRHFSSVTAEHDNSVTLRASACSVELNKQELGNRGRIMAAGRPPLFNSFTCPNCQALYRNRQGRSRSRDRQSRDKMSRLRRSAHRARREASPQIFPLKESNPIPAPSLA